ncbi:SHC-transforming protein 1-like isoform X2 [Antennarius striatus]|uniref:SHC-transforming protein 1-like isoform X2 n=1 Tax=Antennarius striatus TaxID=241820 RepID=UPI0035AED14F
MLKRTKYSRLHNESLTLEDRPLKMDFCSESDFAQLDPGMPHHHHRVSTLRGFIPRMANIRLQSPVCLHGLRGQANRSRGCTSEVTPDRSFSTGDWGSGTNQRFRSQHSQSVPPSTGNILTPSALSCTRRPITLTPSCPPGSEQTTSRAVHHHIKYMGSVEVTQSMRTLDFDTRKHVTREAISRLCERAYAKTTVKNKKPVCRQLPAVLGGINLQFSGNRVVLSVSTDSVTLIAASSQIVHHPMQAISFASGGDPDMADYIAYVAKDRFNQRACHILECSRGQAGEVIRSIGQAFDTCFRQLLSHTPSVLSSNPRTNMTFCHKWHPVTTIKDQEARSDTEAGEHGEYYNVIHRGMTPAGWPEHQTATTEDDQDTEDQRAYLSPPAPQQENCAMAEGTTAPPAGSDFSLQRSSLLSETQTQDLIQDEVWFHGRLGREQAESLLTCSGDFLVRDSGSASGQYVLSGMEGTTVHHVLLVDPHGQVRTRDQVFLTVGHLVRFHMKNQTPIVSGTSELRLKQPVLHTHTNTYIHGRCVMSYLN